jgi:hypothetical protein
MMLRFLMMRLDRPSYRMLLQHNYHSIHYVDDDCITLTLQEPPLLRPRSRVRLGEHEGNMMVVQVFCFGLFVLWTMYDEYVFLCCALWLMIWIICGMHFG